MVQIDVAYEGQLSCRSRHAPSGSEVVTDAPVDNQGRGASFSPTDLVATALGSCMLTIMGIYAGRHELSLEGATVRVHKEMTSEGPRRIARLTVDIVVPEDPGTRHRTGLEAAAKHCPVHKSLHPDIETPVSFRFGA